jgi:spermidine synthase
MPLRSRVAALLFCSGACALVYQVAWLRELRLIFGASTAASAAVLAIFMGGLGLGGALLGRRVDANPQPLLLYAKLELAVAGVTLVTPLLVALARATYIAVGGAATLGDGGATVARLVLALLVLGVPTFLMGGTLPAAARAVETHGDKGRSGVATLYGVNTFGAVTGAVLANFVLIEALGTRQTLFLACALNALVAGVAWRLSKGLGVAAKAEAQAEKEDDVAPAAPARFVLAAAGVVGFAFFLMELVWYRMLGPLLGGSSYTFGLILAVALVGIAVGGVVFAAVGRSRQPTLTAFALTCAVEAAFVILPFAAGDDVALLALFLRPLRGFGFLGLVAAWTVVAALVVLPAAIVSGYQFPMLIALLGSGKKDVGRHIGNAYAANTVGAIVGSLAGGFGLLPVLGATGSWRLVAATLAALGATAVLLAVRAKLPVRAFAGPVAITASVVALLFSTGPTAAWRHSPIGVGRADDIITRPSEVAVENWLRASRDGILWEADGRESSVALNGRLGMAFVVNGKNDGNARSDAATQVFSGLLGAALHASPKRAMVVGLGTGSTAGWLGVIPGMESVDVVELEPAILRVGDDCTPVNAGAMKNPKVHLAIGDAREVLLTTREQYDIVFSEPSNPYRAGISSLYTRDFYEAVKTRLSPKGVFLQWLQAYEVDATALRIAMTTLSSVFPHVSVWTTQQGDLMLLATAEPQTIDAAALRARLDGEPWRSAMAHVWRSTGLETFLAHHIATADFSKAVADEEGPGRVNSDDRNLLEFAFAGAVGRGAGFPVTDVWSASMAKKADRPLVTGEVDWVKVAERRAQLNRVPLPRGLTLSPPRAAMLRAVWRHGADDLPGTLAALRADEAIAAETLLEAEAAAEAFAEVGDARALTHLELVRAQEPVEADALEARYLLRSGKPDEASQKLAAALVAYRNDPWPRARVMYRAILLAGELAALGPAHAERLFTALEKPFSVTMHDGARRMALLEVAMRLDGTKCAAAVAQLEPHFPFERGPLEKRVACLKRAGQTAELARATAELQRLFAASPPPFAKSAAGADAD